ncbi:hypothetical protein [Streptomyces sp. NPDC059378]|uniref:hypothetical protein n=1 Tax=Streptomyces sp. NPDC059378 TaxID=3346815 RepID=UPI003681DEF2
MQAGCLAYLIVRRDDTDPRRPRRLGAAAYGPPAQQLAHDLTAHVEAWGTTRTALPRLTITPPRIRHNGQPGTLISKPESLLTLTY